METQSVFSKMRRVRLVDWILLFVVCFAIYTISNYGKRDVGITEEEEGEFSVYKPRNDREDVRELCQFLEHEIRGEEGDEWLKGNDYEKDLRLRGMHVTFRHGERSPITKVEDATGCLAQREIDRKNFAAYKLVADSDDVQEFLKIDPTLAGFHRYPDDSKCISGNMTAEGALQHLKLGKYFRHRYSKSKLFLEEDQRIVTDVTTSQYYRTYQSILAFSTEFLYKQRDFLSSVFIKASNGSYQCTDGFCNCEIQKKMRTRYEEEHLEEFKRMVDKQTEKEVKEVMGTFPDVFVNEEPFQLIDVVLGRFVCRRRTLPCRGEECVNLDLFNKMIEITTKRGAKMFKDPKSIAAKLQVVESYGILTYLRIALDKVRRFPHTNVIRIFSAHDSVVGPLARVLGLEFVDPPHYTSRIVFEIYEHKDEGLFVRVLYNGINRSDDVRFCKNENFKYGMCRGSAFEEFSKTGLFKLAGVESFKEACTMNQ